MENNQIKNHKEQQINNYITENIIDNPENIDINKIKKDLKNYLYEEPGVEINYKQHYEILESGQEKPRGRDDEIESITIVYTYDRQIVNEKGEYINIPTPVYKTYLLS